MTIIQVHLIMLALGIAAGICVAGSKLFMRPENGRHKSGQQRILGLLAFAVVALSPMIRLWRSSLTELALLQQSFLVAAIGLLALVLYALLQQPKKRHAIKLIDSVETIEEQGMDLQDATVTTDRSTQIHGSNLSFVNNLNRLVIDNQLDAEIAGLSEPYNASTDENIDDNVDLSDTDTLYAELRAQAEGVDMPADVDLPESDEWLTKIDESVNLDDSLVLADEHIPTPANELELPIIEGELLNEELAATATIEVEQESLLETEADAILEFGDESTGEYSHPNLDDQTTPSTLSEALALGRGNSLALQEHIDDLNQKLTELQKINRQLSMEQQQSQLASAQRIVNQDQLLDSEEKARDAAEGVITAQRTMLDRSKQQQAHYAKLLTGERNQLANYREQVERSKTMARQAAQLARKAAVERNNISTIAKREQAARLKSELSTKRAVDIARNAISALAAEERKNATFHY